MKKPPPADDDEDFDDLDPGLSGLRNYEVVYKRKRRGARVGGTSVTLSNVSIGDAAAIGDTIGTLAVVGGQGVYTFTLTYNPGTLFSITGATLKVAAALTVGSDIIVVQADNGAGSVLLQAFTILVTHSGYVPTYELLGF